MGAPVATMPTFQEEDGRAVIPEAMPLFEAHWREIATHQDIPLAVDTAAYHVAAVAGCLRVYTARQNDGYENQLIGYAVYFVRNHPHYRDSLQASQDVLFIHPAHRRGSTGTRLIKYADAQLRALGVQVVHQHVKLDHPALGVLLERQGYTAVEKIYSKRLDKGI